MKKSAVIFVLTTFALFSIFALPVMAEESGNFGDNLTWSLSDDGVLTISGAGEMPDYTYPTYAPWYSYRNSIKSVYIDDGVTSVGNYSFYHYYDAIDSVYISNDMTRIGDFAFYGCNGLTNLTLPDSVTTIGEYSFAYCSNILTVILSKNMSNIENRAFIDCTSLIEIEIPDGVTSVGFEAFENCSSLASVVIPESVTNIDGAAFNGCISLLSIDLPNKLERIGGGAFSGCNSLTSITIPKSVNSIETSAFSNCKHLIEIIVSSDNPCYSSHEGVLYNKYKTNLIQYPSGKKGAFQIPYSVTSIGMGAFSNCSEIVTLEIPNSVVNIGNSAFAGSEKLSVVEIPDSVVKIGTNAFFSCPSLIEINVSESNQYYKSQNGILFNKGATELIKFPAAITGEYTIPDSVTIISDFAFYACSLNSIVVSNNINEIGYNTFSQSKKLISVNLGEGVTRIGAGAFSSCINLLSIELPKNVTKVSYHAFSYCDNLTSVIFDDNVTEIEYNAFFDCDSLQDVYYRGNEEDWNNINIESENECLTNATRHYIPSITMTVKSRKIIVTPKNFVDGNVIIIVAYNNQAITDVQIHTIPDESILFETSAQYDTIKAMGWNSLSAMQPLCKPEITNKKPSSSSGAGGFHS